MSRSYTELKTFAPPADRVPPTNVKNSSDSGGTPSAARNIVGIVVTISNSMIRGLVRPT